MTSSNAQKWNVALNSIIEHLNDSDYKKMLNCLKQIPESVQKGTAREDMARIIIKHHGLVESILEVKRVMEEIPRKDPTVQNLLLPFVKDQNRKMQKENKGQKRKHVRESKEEESEPGQKKKRQGKSNKGHPPPSSKRTLKPWMRTIAELKTLGELCDKAILGKIITKSNLIPYKKKKGFYFKMGLVDDTGCIEVIVFGKERYDFFQNGIYYLLRNIIMSDDTVKVTSRSNVSKTSPFEVPNWLVEAAWVLIHQRVLSIADANESDSGTKMSIQGTVIKEGTGKVKVKKQRKLTAQRFLTLQDDTKQNSIEICFWGDQVSCAAMFGIGDTIRVTNVYSSEYEDSISLNSTIETRVDMIQVAKLETVMLSIQSIACNDEVTLEAERMEDGTLNTFIVALELLANTYGIKHESVEKILVDMLPLSVEAEIQGNKITTLKKMKVQPE